MPDNTESFSVKKFPLTLGQFLKLSNIAQDGIEAKIIIQAGEIMVNNEIDTRRGRKLYENDTVTVNGVSYIICQK